MAETFEEVKNEFLSKWGAYLDAISKDSPDREEKKEAYHNAKGRYLVARGLRR